MMKKKKKKTKIPIKGNDLAEMEQKEVKEIIKTF